MTRGFLTLCAILAATTVLPPSAGAAQVISVGAEYGFLLPNPPYTPDTLRIQIILGYGEPENTIGEQVWMTGPGVYDLSDDPDMAMFLAIAANGAMDDLSVEILDGAGVKLSYPQGFAEPETFGRPVPYLDMWPLEATGIQMYVFQLSVPGSLGLRWEVVGVPEPQGWMLLGLPISTLIWRQHSRHAIGLPRELLRKGPGRCEAWEQP